MQAAESPKRREIAEETKRDALEHEDAELRAGTRNRISWRAAAGGGLLGGVGAGVTGFAGSATVAGLCGIVAAAGNGAREVFALDKKRVDHRQKSADYKAIAADVERALASGDPSDDQLREWSARMHAIRSRA